MTICYLEPDDEITGAVARIRAVADTDTVLVLPPGSRIATSRINFKLLEREARERGLNLVAVSGEPGVRALAISAGVPAYDSVDAAQTALEQFRADDAHLAEKLGRPPGTTGPAETTALGVAPIVAETGGEGSLRSTRTARGAPSVTPVTARPQATPTARPTSTGGAPTRAGMPAPASTPVAARSGRSRLGTPPPPANVADAAVLTPAAAESMAAVRRRRVRLGALLAVGALVLLVAGIAYAGYVFLPTASVTLRPDTLAVGPIETTITADPAVAIVDVANGVIPADQIPLTVQVTVQFPSTGVEVTQTRATGEVRFRSENTLDNVAIPEGTIVSTDDGTEFETTAAVVVPRASFETGPTTADAPIRATRAGPRGNVPADAITHVPNALGNVLISVRNRATTTGGERIEEAAVTQEDYDAALLSLRGQLAGALQGRLSDPATTPAGLTLFRATAQMDEPRFEPLADAMVGTIAPTFTVTADATATVLAVNESQLDEVAAMKLSGSLPAGQEIVGDIATSHLVGTVLGQTITYQVSASAQAYDPPDQEGLLEAIRGKTVGDARAILEQYGTVEITIWPDFVDRVPDQLARVSLTIVPPQESL